LEPGDTLSPIVEITKEGNPTVDTALFINGQRTDSVVWDGRETKVEVKIQCDAASGKTSIVVPAFSPPDPGNLPECAAKIGWSPQNIKPGDQLNPMATVSSVDGKPVQGQIYETWSINGKLQPFVAWDGSETRIELQLSCQGHAQTFAVTLPPYGLQPANGMETIQLPELKGIGNIPGPKSAVEAIVGVLAPGLIAIFGGLLGGLFGNPLPPSVTPVDPLTRGRKLSEDDVSGAPPQPPGQPLPQSPPDIEYTYPDGKRTVLVFNPEHGGYINQLTGGLVDPSEIEGWKQTNVAIQNGVDDFRTRNAELVATHQDAQSQGLAASKAAADARAATVAEVSRIQQAALHNDLWSPGDPGDVVGRSNKILNDIWAGKPVDQGKIDSMRRYLVDRGRGAAADESSLNESRLGNLYGTVDALQGAVRETLTGKDADGNATLAGALTSMFGRLTAGIATAGVSEIGYVAANTGYTMNDAADRGASDGEIIKAGITTAVWEAGPTVLGAGVAHYLPKFFPNVAEGIGEMMKPVGDAVTALDGAVQKGSASLGNRISQALKPAAQLAPGEAIATGQALSADLRATRKALTKLLGAEKISPDDIAQLYSKGGMDQLAELQKAGHLSTDEARLLNSHLATQVNDHIDEAMVQTLKEFEKETGVKVESAMLGDSGSSARPGGNIKVKTDADRTTVLGLNKKSVTEHVQKLQKPVSLDDATRTLREDFVARLEKNVDARLRDKGFKGGVNDVDYKTYNGIGKSAGQADAYPTGVTGVRQTVGTGKDFKISRAAGPDSEITSIKPHKTSGQAVVDQDGLNTFKQTGELPKDPAKFTADEFHDYSAQQLKAVEKYSDIKSVAKAMDRESELSRRMADQHDSPYKVVPDRVKGSPMLSHAEQMKNAGFMDKAGALTRPPEINKNLAEIAALIKEKPSDAIEILQSYRHTEETFVAAVKQEIQRFHSAMPKVLQSPPLSKG
jgi:hypothetical protein